jgi:hypothetical protein
MAREGLGTQIDAVSHCAPDIDAAFWRNADVKDDAPAEWANPTRGDKSSMDASAGRRGRGYLFAFHKYCLTVC